MKTLQCFVLLVSITVTLAKLHVDVTVNSIEDVAIEYSGADSQVITKEDMKNFNITSSNINNALKKHYGRKPTNYYLKSPTPWGDLYKKYYWEEVSRILVVKSATLKNIEQRPIIVHSQDFDNYSSDKKIKVNTGLSYTVENSITTSWTKTREFTVSQEIEYDINVIFAKASGKTGFSYTSTWGQSVEKTETVTIGTNTAVETELEPGQAATAVLTATKGIIEVEVVYAASLKGNVAVNFRQPYKGHHFKAPLVGVVMKAGDLPNELTTKETIRVGMYTDATLKVYDKATGKPL